MKHLLFTTGIVVFAINAAHARPSFELGVSAGWFLDSGKPFGSARAGLQLAQANAASHALDLELGRADIDGRRGSIPLSGRVTFGLANYRLAVGLAPKVDFIAGVGAGFADLSLSSADSSAPSAGNNDTEFAWQACSGLRFHFSDRNSISIGARYFDIRQSADYFDLNKIGIKRASLDIAADVALEATFHFRF